MCADTQKVISVRLPHVHEKLLLCTSVGNVTKRHAERCCTMMGTVMPQQKRNVKFIAGKPRAHVHFIAGKHNNPRHKLDGWEILNLRGTLVAQYTQVSKSNAIGGAERTCVARFSSLTRCCSSSAVSASSASRRKKAGCATCWTHLETFCQATDGRRDVGARVCCEKKCVTPCSNRAIFRLKTHMVQRKRRFQTTSWFRNTLETTLSVRACSASCATQCSA